MKKKILLFKVLFILFLFTFFKVSIVQSQTAVLKHSYTFDDGTANDKVSNAHGTLNGGKIENGAYVASASGQYIVLPADIIQINTYQSITFETYIISSESAPRNAMLYYFGGSVNNYGAYGTFLTPNHWRSDGSTVAAISTVNENQPWNSETYVQESTNRITRTGKHHVVVILTSTNIIMYVDGKLSGSALLSAQGNSIAALRNDYAWIGRGGYTNDPTWLGKLDAFNIYEGVLDEATIQQHYVDFMGTEFFDARLSNLKTNTGKLEPDFNPDLDVYEIKVDYGITSLKLEATPKVTGATYKMLDGLGNEIKDGNVNFGNEGVDIEIIVTALDKFTQKSYYVSVVVNPGENSANLSSINLSTGRLLNAFHPDTMRYTVIVPSGTNSINITGTPAWPGASVTGGGNIQINNGYASTKLTVTSEDGKKIKNYKIDIYESPMTTGKYYYIQQEASGFVIEESNNTYNVIRLGAPIKDNNAQLFEFVETGIPGEYYIRNKASKYIALSPNNTYDLIMRNDLTQNQDSCKFKLIEFAPRKFRIESVIKSASTQKYMGTNNEYYGSQIYSDIVENNRFNVWYIVDPDIIMPFNTYLSDLKVLPDTINPMFVFYRKEYYVIVPESRTSLDVTATASDPSAIVTGTGTININGDRGTIVVKVSSPDGKYTTDYKINYFVNGPLTLRHSYTFANGTAMDMVGNAHGVVNGGIIKDGMYIATQNGHHIAFPGDKIAINSYPAITIETYTIDDDALVNDYNTMVSYFGNTQGSYGTDYLFTSLKSRIAISCKNSSNPWSTESGVSGSNLLDDGKIHHLVGILTYDSAYLYIDGKRINASAVSANNKIFNLSTRYAYLCKSGYVNDKTWMGKVLEHNIYSGIMDTATISARAKNIPIEDSLSDATLSQLFVSGAPIKDFVSYKLNYKVLLPYGTVNVPEVVAIPKYNNSTVNILPGQSLNDTTKIEVTAADGITKLTYKLTFEIDESIINKINKVENNSSIKVYPTIFGDILKIESTVMINSISMYDLSGKLVYNVNGKIYEHLINKNLPDGVYVIKVNHQYGVKLFKVIKN